MLAIPIPFVVAMLLGLLAITLFQRFENQARSSCGFLLLCALTTTLVGLRWTFDLVVLNLFQPILASTIPVAAWYTFAHASRSQGRLSIMHASGPIVVAFSVFTQWWLALPLDELLSLLYVGYGLALLRISYQDPVLINVALGRWEGVKKAESIAGSMLLFSALVDTLMSLDLSFNDGVFSLYILAAAHLLLLPILSLAVIVAGINTPVDEAAKADSLLPSQEGQPDKQGTTITPTENIVQNPENTVQNPDIQEPASAIISPERAQEIVSKLDNKLRSDQLYLDPDLTLSKLTRKLGIPAKHISIAVNQRHQKNISKLINDYRIEHAKHCLATSSDSITQIFLNSGFQTKSNFNREFLRITGMTPSVYRKANG